ncbi:MAG: hypothetical protein L0Y64_01705 [Myxococcaceae bacterium]|nr:hypothetical protein [Myxococcaceae bacterium]
MKRAMRVGELVAALQELPQDIPVFCDGCDCTGPVEGVDLEPASNCPLELNSPAPHASIRRLYLDPGEYVQ